MLRIYSNSEVYRCASTSKYQEVICIKAIYNFLRLKIKKKVYFYDNLNVAVPKIDKNKKLVAIRKLSKENHKWILEGDKRSNSFAKSDKLTNDRFHSLLIQVTFLYICPLHIGIEDGNNNQKISLLD